MNKGVIESLELVLLCCKSPQTVFVDENSKWLHVSDKHIDSQVKFIALNQERCPHVFLNHQMLARVYAVHIFRDEYTLALRHTLWLHYEVNFGLLLDVILNLIFELTHLIGKEPGLREELIVLGKLPFHFLEVSG